MKADYPLSVTCVAGTQAAKMTANNIIVFRMHNLNCVRVRDEDEESDDDDLPESEKPVLKLAGIKRNLGFHIFWLVEDLFELKYRKIHTKLEKLIAA